MEGGRGHSQESGRGRGGRERILSISYFQSSFGSFFIPSLWHPANFTELNSQRKLSTCPILSEKESARNVDKPGFRSLNYEWLMAGIGEWAWESGSRITPSRF